MLLVEKPEELARENRRVALNHDSLAGAHRATCGSRQQLGL